MLPGSVRESEIVQSAADLHHGVADVIGPQPEIIFQDDTAFDSPDDMLDTHATSRQLLVLCLLHVVKGWRFGFLCGIVMTTSLSVKPR